jgi:hypothetical protein
MNSDEKDLGWEDLWRSQPTASSAVNLESFHDSLQAGPDAWEEELARSEKLMMSCSALQFFSGLLDFGDFLRPGPHWHRWIMFVATVALGLGAWFLRRQRQRLQSEFGSSLVERTRRTRRMLRQRLRFDELSGLIALPLAAAVGLMVVERFGASGSVGMGVGVVVLVGLFWVSRQHLRQGRAKLQERLAALDRVDAQLTGRPAAGTCSPDV